MPSIVIQFYLYGHILLFFKGLIPHSVEKEKEKSGPINTALYNFKVLVFRAEMLFCSHASKSSVLKVITL